jgi:hypothetical protein
MKNTVRLVFCNIDITGLNRRPKGTMEVLDDKKIKEELWKDEFPVYYKGGAERGGVKFCIY